MKHGCCCIIDWFGMANCTWRCFGGRCPIGLCNCGNPCIVYEGTWTSAICRFWCWVCHYPRTIMLSEKNIPSNTVIVDPTGHVRCCVVFLDHIIHSIRLVRLAYRNDSHWMSIRIRYKWSHFGSSSHPSDGIFVDTGWFRRFVLGGRRRVGFLGFPLFVVNPCVDWIRNDFLCKLLFTESTIFQGMRQIPCQRYTCIVSQVMGDSGRRSAGTGMSLGGAGVREISQV